MNKRRDYSSPFDRAGFAGIRAGDKRNRIKLHELEKPVTPESLNQPNLRVIGGFAVGGGRSERWPWQVLGDRAGRRCALSRWMKRDGLG